MNAPIVCQVFSSYTEDHPKLFHDVEKLVTNGKFEHAAVYEIIDDPYYAGSYPLDTSNGSYPFLTILRSNLSYRIGGEDQRIHSPSLTWTYEGTWRQFGPYHADDLSTISNEACSEPNGPSVGPYQLSQTRTKKQV
ncbi:hypothetical protein C1H76_0673 [Elsinoe australis]|uniref:Uncharacterized protein n=1 Tax=Elsinoe australis TaxID=40998 RepID=A0A4U7B7A1_9PEZI|nr:hypothetical protein C1H76_0673 [Elsinoe australis]